MNKLHALITKSLMHGLYHAEFQTENFKQKFRKKISRGEIFTPKKAKAKFEIFGGIGLS